VQLQERLLGLDQRRLAECRARERRTHREHMHLYRHARELNQRLAPVDLRLHPRRMDLRDEHVPDRPAQPPLARPDVLPDRDLRNIGAVLIDQAPMDPPDDVALLARRLAIGRKPRVDHRPIRTQPRRRPAHRRALDRRRRRRQRLTHRPAMHPVGKRAAPGLRGGPHRLPYPALMADAREVEFVFEPQEEGGYHVYAPDLPGLHTQGDPLDEATDNAREALELYVEGLREDGRSIDTGVVRRKLPLPA
jgi:predicted RNase H-like HicB family nuclease